MTVAIIGLGNMGKGLAARLAGKTDLVLGVRDAAASANLSAQYGNARIASVADAIAAADIVVLALPYAIALGVAGNSDLAGKVVVDMSNPITPDFAGLLLGFTTSAAEEIQAVAPDAKVVKAFNTIFSILLSAPVAATATIPVFVAGNAEAAVAKVSELVKLCGFAAENAGGLDAARLIEPLGLLNIRFGYGLGHGTSIAPQWVKVPA